MAHKLSDNSFWVMQCNVLRMRNRFDLILKIKDMKCLLFLCHHVVGHYGIETHRINVQICNVMGYRCEISKVTTAESIVKATHMALSTFCHASPLLGCPMICLLQNLLRDDPPKIISYALDFFLRSFSSVSASWFSMQKDGAQASGDRDRGDQNVPNGRGVELTPKVAPSKAWTFDPQIGDFL